MPQKAKLFLMFTPLAMLLLGLVVFVMDVKNPAIERQRCKVLASGLKANHFRETGRLLYTSSGRKVHDVALQCPTLGTLVINDFDVFVAEIAPGDLALLTHRQYKVLPERWAIDIHHKADPKKKGKRALIPLAVDQF